MKFGTIPLCFQEEEEKKKRLCVKITTQATVKLDATAKVETK